MHPWGSMVVAIRVFVLMFYLIGSGQNKYIRGEFSKYNVVFNL